MREQHEVNYVCSLTWNKTVQQSLTYTLTIAYKPSQMSFKLNNIANSMVTVAENTTVTMLCQSDGRPAPSMTITDVTNGNRVLQSLPGGNTTQADQRELGHTITVVQCEASGEYRCAAKNDLGQMYQSLNLFVRCKPRSKDPNSASLNITEGKSASFHLIAYPTSVNVTKYYLGQDMNTKGPAREEVFRVTCNVNFVNTYTVICTVYVTNVTSGTSGYYKLVVSNELGNTSFIFAAIPRNITEDSTLVTSGGFPAGAIAGIAVGFVVIIGIVVIVVVCFCRQKGGGRENTGHNPRQDILFDKANDLPLSLIPEHETQYESIGISETGQTAVYTNVQGSHLSSRKTLNKTENVYDGLDLQDVGVSSPYSSLK